MALLATIKGWFGLSEQTLITAPTTASASTSTVVRSDAAVRTALARLASRRGYGEFTLGEWDVDLMREAIAAADAVDFPNGVTPN